MAVCTHDQKVGSRVGRVLGEDRRDGAALARQAVNRHLDPMAGEIGGRVRTRFRALCGACSTLSI